METRLFGYLNTFEADPVLLSKLSELRISINMDYLTARRSGLTIEESLKALSLAREFSKYGLEVILNRFEAKTLADTSIVIKRWKRIAESPTVKKLPRLV